MKNTLLALFAVSVLVAVGCDSNPTNAPTKAAVEDANAARLKAIEENPNLTAEQKEMQKRMMGLTDGGRGGEGQAGTVPTKQPGQ
jgi:hypothetical protein